ncbi:MAG: ATP-binding protein [Pseudomonadota bacterium]
MTDQKNTFANFATDESEAGPKSLIFDRALRLLPSIAYIFNQETQCNEYANRNIGEVMGYTEAEIQAFGANLMATLSHPDDLPDVLQHFKRISRLRDGEVASVEYRIRHKDNRWVWFLSMDTVFDRDAKGRVRRHLGAAADITRQKEAEERAVAATHAAEVANEDLRAFAYSISHDMKSPSNTLHLLLSELHKTHSEAMDSDARQLVDHAIETVDSMQRRILRVLDYTRLIDQKYAFGPVSLDTVLVSVLSDMAADIKATGAQIDVGPLPLVSGAEEELKILFQNLISNAIKFRKEGRTPHVRIRDTSDPEESELSITVSDNGIGVPEKSFALVFEMFKRLHSERTFEGSGLGLAICRRIAISHGGDIFLNSEMGEGSAFTVQLRSSDDIWRRQI